MAYSVMFHIRLNIKNHLENEIGNSALFELLSPTSKIWTLCSTGPQRRQSILLFAINWTIFVAKGLKFGKVSSMRSALVFFAALAVFCGNAFGVKFRMLIPFFSRSKISISKQNFHFLQQRMFQNARSVTRIVWWIRPMQFSEIMVRWVFVRSIFCHWIHCLFRVFI